MITRAIVPVIAPLAGSYKVLCLLTSSSAYLHYALTMPPKVPKAKAAPKVKAQAKPKPASVRRSSRSYTLTITPPPQAAATAEPDRSLSQELMHTYHACSGGGSLEMGVV